MRSKAVLGYSLLFFLSGATGLVYELLWVRLLYQAFGSTIQSVTTVVAAYMGGLGLGAWWFGRRADRHPRPAALGAVLGTALAGFVLIEYAGIRASLWGTALVNFAIGMVALTLSRAQLADPGRKPGELGSGLAEPTKWEPLRTLALALLGLTAFAALLDEIAWTRVLVMIVGGSTYAFTLVLLTFLLGIGLGSAFVARARAISPPRQVTAASAGAAQGLTAAGAALLFLFFGQLPRYILAVFQVPGATARLALLGLAVGAVVLVPAIGMGMTFPLLTDLVAREDEARGADVGRAYARNTPGGIAGAR